MRTFHAGCHAHGGAESRGGLDGQFNVRKGYASARPRGGLGRTGQRAGAKGEECRAKHIFFVSSARRRPPRDFSLVYRDLFIGIRRGILSPGIGIRRGILSLPYRDLFL